MSATLGALVITRNEELSIDRCLRSLDFCDERIVVDSFSEDRTVEIARRRAEHVYRRQFLHHADQKNWGLAQCLTDWVLIVDADEVVPSALAREARERIEDSSRDGYWLRRSNTFFGREIRGAGWNRDRVLRLLRRGRGRYPERYLHEEIRLDRPERVGTCDHALVHHSYERWDSSFERLLAYSTRGAHERERRGRRAGAADLAFRPALRFLRQYVLQAGFRDGAHGVALCAWSAAGIFLREAKLMLGETEVPTVGGNSEGSLRVERVQGREPSATGTDGNDTSDGHEEAR